MTVTTPPKYLEFAALGKQILKLIHHFQAYNLAFSEGERFLIEDDDIVADIMKLLTAKNSAGFDRMATLYFNDDQSFSGIVEDFISIRLIKRYAFRANDTTLQYRLINPDDVDNFSESEEVIWEFTKTKTGKKKQAKCITGVPCEPICLRATYVCLHDFNEQEKKILKSAQAKALRLKAKMELKGEKFIDYEIDRSDSKAVAKLGKQFISHYISTSEPSARELELKNRQKEIEKEIAKAKKAGKYNSKDLNLELGVVIAEYKTLSKERTTRLESELFVLRKALIAHQGVPQGALDQLANRVKFDASVPDGKVDKIKEDLKGFYALTGTAGHENLKTIEFSNKLASSNLEGGRLNIGSYVTDDRLWNQAARHWEKGSPELNQAATEWRNQRATSPNPVKLNSLVKNGTYGNDEVALPGNYLDPYLGKVHGGKGSPTEVLAMGMERLSNAKRMVALHKKDPEYLEFLVGTLVAANKNALPPKLDPPKPEPKRPEAKKVELKKPEAKKVEPKKKEEVFNYKIDTSDHKAVIGLGQQFAKKYFTYLAPSAEELSLKAKNDALKKQFSDIQKKGGGSSPTLVKEMMTAGKAYSAVADKRQATMRKQLRNLLGQVIDKHGMSESELDALVAQANFTGDAKTKQKEVADTLKKFYSLTNGIGSATIQNIGKDKDRAYANQTLKYVNIGSNPTDSVLLHEFAHHLEFNNPKINQAAQAWRDSRATGAPEKLSVLMKNSQYSDDEVAIPDRFVNPYVGKIYLVGSTEVLSMGVERFSSAERMLTFYENDSEHFHFILGALLGEEK